MGVFDQPGIISVDTLPEKSKTESVTPINNLFHNIDEIKKERGIKILGYGKWSDGKSHFSFTGQEPLYIIDTERAATLMRAKFPNKEIYVLEAYVSKPGESERDDVATYEKIVQAVDFLYSKNLDRGTIVIDSITDIWKMCQNYAKIKIWNIKPGDRLKYQWDWGKINDLYKNVILKLLHTNCDVILLARAQQEYNSSGQALDEWSANVQKDTEYLVDVVLRMKRMLDKNKNIVFSVEIDKCRDKGELIARTFENFDMNKLKELIGR